MRKRFWIALVVLILVVGLVLVLLIVPEHLPTAEELLESCQIPPSEVQFSAQDFADAVAECLTYPVETVSEEEAGAEMYVYSYGGEEAEEAVDALSVTYLADAVQYEFFDSETGILYNAQLPLGVTPDIVTAADFAAVSITAIDVYKLQSLMQ